MKTPYYLLALGLMVLSCKKQTKIEVPVVLECDFLDAVVSKQDTGRVVCGYLEVPENYAQPKGRKINIAYAVLKSKHQKTDASPMIYFSGGPGGRSIDARTINGWLNTKLNEERDIILFDQRGIHYSSALPDIGMALFEAMAQDANETKEIALFAQVLESYKKRSKEQGIDLASYNSFESAKDVGFLMQHLGYEKYNLYGISYGTRLARIIQDLFPEKINSVILDSPAPLQGDFLLSRLESYSQALRQIFDFCAKDPDCNAQFPDLENDYTSAILSFKDQPMEVIVDDTSFYINAQDAIYFLRRGLYGRNSKLDVPNFIKALLERDTKTLEQAVANEKNGMLRFLNTSMLLSVECYEQFNANNNSEIIEAAYQKSDLFPAKLGFFTALYNAGQSWHDKKLADHKKTYASSAIPTLIFVNQYDPVTPPKYGWHFKEKLSNVQLFILDQGGHGATFNPCSMEVMMDFMTKPDITSLNSSCLSLYKD